MHIVFYSTSDVFKAEEMLNEMGLECSVVPTPVQDKAYCGVCIEIEGSVDPSIFGDMEFEQLK